ncbi:disease resistance protein RPM1 protein [Dioscorea alata]|uniref:Disease resistance protein RPM1 protein n=1 Tax=Dioscorea alata TaxID=55571 RepID=A0ACB7WMB7_DIOAL|nr:disease resistance protein RPM1 protein [Dioscorea alata]
MEAVVLLLVEKISVALGTEVMNAIQSLLAKEASLVAQIPGTMNRIQREFVVMKAFLKHADMQKEKSSTLQAWLDQVQKTAFQVEDIIDEYSYLIGEQYRSGFRGSVYNYFHKAKHALAWHRVADQLQEIESDLRQISEMRTRYDIKTDGHLNHAITRDFHRADFSYTVADDELVGIGEEREQLLEWLTDEKSACSRVAIWGMGGLGKTTLATNIYKSPMIQKHFDCHAWITVSQNYSSEDLLRKILLEFLGKKQAKSLEIDTMAHSNLVETLRNFLQDKKYILILDDVWNTDAWYVIKHALIDTNRGSRIVITTRIKDVSLLASKNRVLELRSLEPKEAWDLFCRKVFWEDEDKKCPEVLEPLAEKIVGKCQGLPLAIVAIGSLLSLREINEEEWRKVHDHLNWELTDNPYLNVRHTLNLSFIYLPDYLKNCFLYLSIFPEDYVIKKKRLINLWVAEGFIEEKGAKTMEEVAEEYFNELIHRCMLQVVERNLTGMVKRCRMHDLVRELNVSTAKAKRFSAAYDGTEVAGLDGESRRLSLHSTSQNMQLSPSLSSLRSFFIFDTMIPASLLTSVIKQFRLLRVLYLQKVMIEEVPDEVFNLFNLHYLSLRKTKVKELPNSIIKLRNLQTLDLEQTKIEKLPRGITELKKLRNLVIERTYDPNAKTFNSICGAPALKGMWDLKGLQTLQYVEANERFIRQISNLTQLRTLGITKVKSIHCAELCASLTKMRFLDTLAVMAYNEDESLELEALNPPPRALERLRLRGKLARGLENPLFYTLGTTLIFLYLGWSGLREDPLPSLSHMSNLVVLCLAKAYEGRLLKFSTGWFPKLRGLSLTFMENLQRLEIQDGSLQSLVLLELGYLEGMKGCPLGIQFLDKLEQLLIQEMPKEFIVDLQGSSRNCVKHIPNIIRVSVRGGEFFRENLFQHGSTSCVDMLGAPSANRGLQEQDADNTQVNERDVIV